MQSITKSATFATILGLAWACTTPTEMCGCSPVRPSLAIAGTLQDSLGAPIPNRSFVFEATSEAAPTHTFVATDAQTDATGAFAVRAFSVTTGTHLVVARIIRSPQNDTVRIPAGSATFKVPSEHPDTLRVNLRQP